MLNDANAKLNRQFLIGLLMLAVAGPAMVLICTPWGIGLTPDSATYIGSAYGLATGHGFARPVSNSMYSPVTHYMPAFPAVLAAIVKLGVRPLHAARFTQAMVFACNIALAGIVIYFSTQGSVGWALIGACLILLAPNIILIHSLALSEGLFLLVSIAAVAATARSIQRPTLWRLLATGVLLSLSYLTRYIGVAFIAAAPIAILLFGQTSWRRRFLNAVIISALPTITIVAWMFRNQRSGSAAVGRQAVWHPVTARHLQIGLINLFGWLAPSTGRTLIISTSIALLAAIVTAFFMSRQQSRSHPPSVLPKVIGLFAVLYIVFVLLSISLFDYMAQFDPRILSPLLGLVIVAACVLGASTHGRRRTLAVAACAAIVVQWTFASAAQLTHMRQNGLGYASPLWLKSQTLRAIHRLPSSTLIYSDHWDVIYLLDERGCETLPGRMDAVTNQPIASFEQDMQTMANNVKLHGGVIVFFRNGKSRPGLPTEPDLQAIMPLRALFRQSDGTIYAAAEP
jgi:MFS family permease